MKVYKFRYNMQFNEMKSKNFFIDFLNSPQLNKVVTEIMITSKIVSNCQLTKLKTQLIDLSFLDVLEKRGIITNDGTLRQTYDSYVEDIHISDLLKECMYLEESENWDVFTEEVQKELLFCVFKHIVGGGSLCQFEENVQPYKDATKLVYKNLVCARKRQDDEVYIDSFAYRLGNVDGKNPLVNDHCQTFCYFIVSPAKR